MLTLFSSSETLLPRCPRLRSALQPLHRKRIDLLCADVAGEDRRGVMGYGDLDVSVPTCCTRQVLQACDHFHHVIGGPDTHRLRFCTSDVATKSTRPIAKPAYDKVRLPKSILNSSPQRLVTRWGIFWRKPEVYRSLGIRQSARSACRLYVPPSTIYQVLTPSSGMSHQASG